MNFSFSIGKRSFRIQTGKTSGPVAQNRGPSALGNIGGRMFASAATNRLTADWPVSISSADAEILTSAIATRSRLRKAERDDDYFRNMLWLLENNIIGDHGIRLRPKARDLEDKLDKVTNKLVQDAWSEATSEENCVVSRDRNGVEIQRLAVRALARDGVILFRIHRGFKNAFGFALEPIEVDRLDHWWNRPAVGTANEIKFGLELDQYKAVVAYYILTRHPGDVFAYSSSPKYRERVPAEDIIPIWTIERAGQSIGMPLWPSVAKRLQNLYGYEESEQTAARAGSCKGGWFKRTDKGSEEYVGQEDGQGNQVVDTAPGQWEELPLGLEPVINDPKHPTDQFQHFVAAQLRGAAAGGYLPYSAVANDLSSINYSSYKAGMNDARDGFKYLQQLVMRKLMRRWYREWVPYAILSGKLQLPASERERIQKSDRWKPRRWAGLEPLKEVQANALAVECGFDSRRNIIEEDYDRDIEDVDDDQQHDNESAKAHNLDFSSDPHKPVIGAGKADTGTAPDKGEGPGGSTEEARAHVNGNGHKNGHNGNGHSNGDLRSDLLKELRDQRYDFREAVTRIQPVAPVITIDNKPRGKRSLKIKKDEDGALIVEETREEPNGTKIH